MKTPGLNRFLDWLVVKVLARVPYWSKRVSLGLFYQLAKLMPQATVEGVVLSHSGEQSIEILLIQRPANDPFHASEWAIPGAVITNGDDSETLVEPLVRLQKEIGANFSRAPIFVGYTNARTPRGRVVGLVHLIRVDGEPNQGKWFDVKNLPELGPGPGKLTAHHLKDIQLAVKYFETSLSRT